MNPDILLTIFGRGRTVTFFPTIAEAGFQGKILSMEAGTGDDELRAASKAAPGIDVYSYARYVSGGQGEGSQVDALAAADRKRVVSGKSVSVRVDLGGRRFIKKTNQENNHGGPKKK